MSDAPIVITILITAIILYILLQWGFEVAVEKVNKWKANRTKSK